jgi:YVTN family beta-propeller protein
VQLFRRSPYLCCAICIITIVATIFLSLCQPILAQNEVNNDLKDSGIIYNPSNQHIYVIHDWQRSLTAINSSNQIDATIFVGEEPIFMAYYPENENLYVIDRYSGTVPVVSSSNKVVAMLDPVEECAPDCWPNEIAYNPFDKKLYVTDSGDDELIQYNADNEIIGRVYTNTDPSRLLASEHAAFDTKNNKTYVANSNSRLLSVISGSNQTVEEIDVGHEQELITYVPFTENIYVSLGDRFYSPNGTVSIVNTSNYQVNHLRFDKLYNEKYIEDISYNPHNEQIYFAGSKNVYVVDDANQITSTIPVGGGPCSIAYNPANNNMYIGTRNSTVAVIDDANQITSTIPVGGGPCSIAYNPANGYMYTLNYGSATVSVINDRDQVIANIPIPFLDPQKYPS